MNDRLSLERQQLIRAWGGFVHRRAPEVRPDVPGADLAGPDTAGPDTTGPTVTPEVAASWARSALTVSPERVCAPVLSETDVRHAWRESALEYGMRGLIPELTRLAEDADLIVAVGDVDGTLLWTQGSERMTALARRVNFVPGGQWGEGTVGTNALALSLRTRRPVRVFSAEHYVQTVHDWVCYSSPIRDPGSGALLGVLDLSSTWEHSTPLGLASARHYAAQIEQAIGGRPHGAADALSLSFCGSPRVTLGGRRLHLTPRQHELLGVLALNPGGLSLDALHAHVYGDQPVSLSTLKSEVSTLRALLGGQIASRPYRLSVPVTLDAQRIEEHLLAGRAAQAAELFDGPLLPNSASPLLTYWREYLGAAVQAAVCRSGDPDLLWRYASRFDDPECLDVLDDLLPAGDPRRPVVRARRAALDAF
ncbi:GAF domain-containing protein [Deinococcus sp. JMULE3]|uniref:GAF domain-containing protein n=1 Tax=Deinococcus sp. JMULE3 TaxID=2518341 RepID=UPI001576BFDF|nr:helix-turn-helix domain-containing protein [Deinococcus sp. JMULE3]